MKSLLVICLIFGALSSCTNALSELGNPNSDEALLYDAQAALDAGNYQEAIDIITTRISASGQQTNAAREILASGYAGRCGLNFVEYTQELANAADGSVFTRSSFPFVHNQEIDPPSCLSSLQTLDQIGPFAARTARQNMFAAIVGMVLMGSATRLYTDDTPVGGDEVPDAPDASCTMTDEQVDLVILGFGYMTENFAALGSSQIGAGSSTAISDAIVFCGGSCATTDPAAITPLMRLGMREVMLTAQYGINFYTLPANIPASCL